MDLKMPARVVYGNSSIDDIPGLIPGERVLLVTGRSFAEKSRLLQRLMDMFGKAGKKLSVFSGASPEPGIEEAEACLEQGRDGRAESVIAVGGGSALDVGKTAAGLMNCSGSAQEYFKGREIEEKPAFFCAVPTTAGTGSEATPNAVLTSADGTVKKSIRTDSMIPDLVALDPELTLSCPQKVTAYSGMDAFVQAVESLFSRHADALTSAYALSAVKLINGSIVRAYSDGSDLSAREQMLYGSFTAGVAFSNSRLGAVHGFAHPVGTATHLPHGLICARLLLPVLKRNREAVPRTYEMLSETLKTDPLKRISHVMEELSIPETFDCVIDAQKTCLLFEYTAKAGSMKANPVDFTEEQQKDILAEAGLTLEG